MATISAIAAVFSSATCARLSPTLPTSPSSTSPAPLSLSASSFESSRLVAAIAGSKQQQPGVAARGRGWSARKLVRPGTCRAQAAAASDGSAPVTASSAPGTAVIQFIRGMDELVVPDVRLTRSRDGSSGTATFVFDQPSVFDSSRELGDITGLYLIDDEGVISSIEVSAKFTNGKPSRIESRLVMRSSREWDRFMRFMERYAEQNNLGFVKK